MTRTDQLLQEIAIGKRHVDSLKMELKTLQANCDHEYIEESTYRVCRNCKFVESSHY